MPWPPKQERAIFLDLVRRKGKSAAIDYMHHHGYPQKGEALRKARKKRKQTAR